MISGVIAVPLGCYIIKSWLEYYDYPINFTWFIFVEAIFVNINHDVANG